MTNGLIKDWDFPWRSPYAERSEKVLRVRAETISEEHHRQMPGRKHLLKLKRESMHQAAAYDAQAYG